nr:MAG TPA: SurA N-terminal domain [Caudoviricetes sp.]
MKKGFKVILIGAICLTVAGVSYSLGTNTKNDTAEKATIINETEMTTEDISRECEIADHAYKVGYEQGYSQAKNDAIEQLHKDVEETKIYIDDEYQKEIDFNNQENEW